MGAPGRVPCRGGRAVEPPGPRVVEEVLTAELVLVTVQEDRHAFERPAVLVQVGGERRHARHAQVPRRHRFAEALPEGQQPTTEAGIDVAQDVVLGRQRSQLGDRVDDAVRVARRRAHDERGAVTERFRGGGEVEPAVVAHRDEHVLHVEVVGRLGEGGVRGRRRHQLGLADPLGLPGPLARHLHGEEDALGPAGGELAGRLRVAEQVRRHPHHLLLHAEQAREREGVEVVLVQVLEGDGPLELLERLVAGVVDEAERPAAAPVGVAAPSLGDLRDDVRNRSARGGEGMPVVAHAGVSGPCGGHVGSSCRRNSAHRPASSSSPISAAARWSPARARRKPRFGSWAQRT